MLSLSYTVQRELVIGDSRSRHEAHSMSELVFLILVPFRLSELAVIEGVDSTHTDVSNNNIGLELCQLIN